MFNRCQLLLSNHYVDNCIPRQQLNVCQTLYLCEGCGLRDYPMQDPLQSFLIFSASRMFPIMEASVTDPILCEMSKHEQFLFTQFTASAL